MKFNPDIDVRTLRLSEKLPAYVSANQQSLGELFRGFLQYYACEFKQVFAFIFSYYPVYFTNNNGFIVQHCMLCIMPMTRLKVFFQKPLLKENFQMWHTCAGFYLRKSTFRNRISSIPESFPFANGEL